MASEQPTHEQVKASTAATEATMPPQRVPVNVYESSGALVILAPLPSVKADDVTVELKQGTVRFYATLRSSGPREYLVHEWEYGGFEREVDVPEGFGAGLEASLANGQLAVRVLRGDFAGDASIHPNPL